VEKGRVYPVELQVPDFSKGIVKADFKAVGNYKSFKYLI